MIKGALHRVRYVPSGNPGHAPRPSTIGFGTNVVIVHQYHRGPGDACARRAGGGGFFGRLYATHKKRAHPRDIGKSTIALPPPPPPSSLLSQPQFSPRRQIVRTRRYCRLFLSFFFSFLLLSTS